MQDYWASPQAFEAEEMEEEDYPPTTLLPRLLLGEGLEELQHYAEYYVYGVKWQVDWNHPWVYKAFSVQCRGHLWK